MKPAVRFSQEQDEAILSGRVPGRVLAGRYGVPRDEIYRRRRWLSFHLRAVPDDVAQVTREEARRIAAEEIAALRSRIALVTAELRWLRDQIAVKTHSVTTA